MSYQGMPYAFIWRRMHSLFGVLLVGFIFMHLLTNSQAALFFGDDGEGFIHHVNQIHSLPFLPVIEVGVLGLFFVGHAILGIRYLFSAEANSRKSDGSSVSLPDLPRNKAYTWQRITSWILVFAIAGHVIHMRINRYPVTMEQDGAHRYIVKVSMDRGLYTVADRLGVDLFDNERITEMRLALPAVSKEVRMGESSPTSLKGLMAPLSSEPFSEEREERLRNRAHLFEKRESVAALEKVGPSKTEVAAVAPDIGTAILLTVRDAFKYPLMLVLYTLFVPIATFHACNGLWTALISWGVTLTERAQKLANRFCWLLMLGLNFLGWIAVWGTYWINLRY